MVNANNGKGIIMLVKGVECSDKFIQQLNMFLKNEVRYSDRDITKVKGLNDISDLIQININDFNTHVQHYS